MQHKCRRAMEVCENYVAIYKMIRRYPEDQDFFFYNDPLNRFSLFSFQEVKSVTQPVYLHLISVGLRKTQRAHGLSKHIDDLHGHFRIPFYGKFAFRWIRIDQDPVAE